MRALRIVVLAAGLVVAAAIPAGGLTIAKDYVDVAITPVGGTPGATITVTGHCSSASEGDAYLEHPVTSDAIRPPLAHSHFVVTNTNFSTSLQNPAGSENGFPLDLHVRVTCNYVSAEAPFHASDRALGSTPSIFASLGETPCGFAFVPAGTDARIPCPEQIKGFDASGALATTNFYRNSFFRNDATHGASIAVGDVDGDGQVDLVTGSGPGAPANVFVSRLDGTPIASFNPYGDFAGGLTVAVGDVTGDGHNDVVTGAGPGGGPHVVVLSYDTTNRTLGAVSGFYAYDPGFHGGVNVAVGQFDSRFTPEIVTGPGPGGGPDVRRFTANGTIRASFYAYDAHFGGGVNVATLPGANRLGQIVTGAGPGGGPHVKVFPGDGMYVVAGWYAYDPSFRGGVSVGAGTVDGAYQIVTGAGPGGGPHIRVFNLDGFVHNGGWYAFAQCCGAGVKVAVAP